MTGARKFTIVALLGLASIGTTMAVVVQWNGSPVGSERGLLEDLESRDEAVKMSAVWELARLKSHAAVPRLIQEYTVPRDQDGQKYYLGCLKRYGGAILPEVLQSFVMLKNDVADSGVLLGRLLDELGVSDEDIFLQSCGAEGSWARVFVIEMASGWIELGSLTLTPRVQECLDALLADSNQEVRAAAARLRDIATKLI